MTRWKEILVSVKTPIREVIQILDQAGLQIVLVVDSHGKLLGTVTDGDIRRGILKGLSLEGPVSLIMNQHPEVVRTNESREKILATMKSKGFRHMPLVDEAGLVMGLDTLDELINSQVKKNKVVLMAGGLGTRLAPLTADCPKPMLRVGNKPLLETILDNFIEHGFKEFYIAVNHKADVVKTYFEDGSKWGAKIQYLEENQRLGTAGALSLIPDQQNEPLFVMNGDLLTKVNFSQFLDFHLSNQAMATMCVREYDFQVPYGVVKLDKHRIVGIDEKPTQRFFVNAGIYLLEPRVLEFIEPKTYLDMPTLFEKMMKLEQETVVFPIREYWLDIGQMADYDRANGEYKTVFSD